MPHHLPDNILCLFEAGPPIEFFPPIEKKSRTNYSSVSSYLKKFEEPPSKHFKPTETNEFSLLRHEEIRKIKRERRYRQEMEKITKQLTECMQI